MQTDDEMVKVLMLYSLVELTLDVSGRKLCHLYSITGEEQGVSTSVEALYTDVYFMMISKVDLIESEN